MEWLKITNHYDDSFRYLIAWSNKKNNSIQHIKIENTHHIKKQFNNADHDATWPTILIKIKFANEQKAKNFCRQHRKLSPKITTDMRSLFDLLPFLDFPLTYFEQSSSELSAKKQTLGPSNIVVLDDTSLTTIKSLNQLYLLLEELKLTPHLLQEIKDIIALQSILHNSSRPNILIASGQTTPSLSLEIMNNVLTPILEHKLYCDNNSESLGNILLPQQLSPKYRP